MKSKLYILFSVLVLLCFQNRLKSQIIYSEGFESGSIPFGWSQQYITGNINWIYQNGGNSGNPPNAHTGIFNAHFFYGSFGDETTKLISSEINTTTLIQPLLTFWHAQKAFSGDIDELKIYYRESAADSWQILVAYSDEVSVWTKREILLPVSSATLQIAFEAKTGYGYGVCVDDITIEEAPSIQKFVESIDVVQDNISFVYPNTINNPVIRIDVNVEGYSGNLILNQIIVKSKNTNDSDIQAGGLKIYYSSDDEFSTSTQIGTNEDFVLGNAVFSAINFDLLPGMNYFWISFDIKVDATNGNIIDAEILAHNIDIAGLTLPITDESPDGEKIILTPVFFDDFSSITGWTLSGEFEIAEPQGLGGSYGNPDPGIAFIGNSVLGTDLTGLGLFPYDYEPNLSNKAYQAISPTIDCSFYVNTSLKFQRWMNLDFWDNATLEISNNNGATWNVLWNSPGLMEALEWNLQEFDISNFADDSSQVKIRFTLGSSDGTWNFSGWNIDQFAITGDFIEHETGVTEILAPQSGCGHTSTETIVVLVRNFAGAPTNDTIPVCFSAYEGTIVIMDTIFGSIPVGGDTVFTFNNTVDLSVPELYVELFAATLLPGDQNQTNDTAFSFIAITPIFSVPYFENFESGANFWIPGGSNSSWELGLPSGLIVDTAGSGINSWMTNLNGNYNDNEISWVESPCFDFTGAENMMFEMKANWVTDLDFDGAAVLFSTDLGSTWEVLGLFGDEENWYNYELVEGLVTGFEINSGWNNNSFGWITVSHVLPAVFDNNPNIKFRIVFGTDNSVNHFDGFAFDDIRIFAQTPDIQALIINQPISGCELSDAEHISISSKSVGNIGLNTGDEIVFGFSVNGSTEILETFVLTEPLNPGDTINYTFVNIADFSLPGNYSIKAFSKSSDDLDPNNDTTNMVVEIYGFPEIDLGSDIYTLNPDTVVIDAWIGDEYSYVWDDSSTDSEYFVSAAGTFFVTVSDVYACSSTDSISVVSLIADISCLELLYPQSSCLHNSNEIITIGITNQGTYEFPVGTELILSWTVNGAAFIEENLVLTTSLPVLGNMEYSFFSLADMSEFIDYNFIVTVTTAFDTITNNDSLPITVSSYGFPEIDLGADTIFTNQPDTVIFDAGSDFENYLWQDLSTEQTFHVSEYGTFYVAVTDINGCTGFDTIIVDVIDIIEQRLISNIEIYPNPTKDFIIINTGNETLPLIIEISEIMGKLVYKSEIENNLTYIMLTGKFYPGVYNVVVKGAKTNYLKRIVIME